ncbi:MAG: RNA methyltransferase [Alphaproteobacteria bacterium]
MTNRTVTITHIGHRGDGIAGEIFVPFTLPGEKVEVSGTGDRLALERVITPSADRKDPFCPHFGKCGGCALQHWEGEPYREWKRDLIAAALRQQGITAEIGDTIDAHGAGRRRVTLHARRIPGSALVVGFTEARTHTIIPIDVCPILAPQLSGAIGAARALAACLVPKAKPVDVQVTAAENGLDVDVSGIGPVSVKDREALLSVAASRQFARLTLLGELVYQREPPWIMVGPARVVLPPRSFLQATHAGEEVLAELVSDAVGPARAIADLFCGIGPFALRLAANARVVAADSDAQAVAALATAARSVRGLKPVTAETRDLSRRPLLPADVKSLDAVIFDPPRAGAEAQCRALAKADVGCLVAVSCNPATFARDAAILIAGGWKIDGITPVDQFKYSAHVELVARFSR